MIPIPLLPDEIINHILEYNGFHYKKNKHRSSACGRITYSKSHPLYTVLDNMLRTSWCICSYRSRNVNMITYATPNKNHMSKVTVYGCIYYHYCQKHRIEINLYIIPDVNKPFHNCKSIYISKCDIYDYDKPIMGRRGFSEVIQSDNYFYTDNWFEHSGSEESGSALYNSYFTPSTKTENKTKTNKNRSSVK